MSYKTAYLEVMRAYEADRDSAAALADGRRAEVYAKIPRVSEIDARLAEIGAGVARLALAGEDGALESLRAESAALRGEKAALFMENRIPPDYLTAVYRCAACRDTGYAERPDAPPERCACLKQRLIDKYYELSNLKDILAAENFDTFDLRYYGEELIPDEGLSPHQNMQRVYGAATRFTQNFGQFQNLLLYGKTGLGKTFICNCVAKEVLDMGHTVLYLTAPRLFKLIEDDRFKPRESEEAGEIIESVCDVELLILDDLGSEFSTLITKAALFDIINQRILSRKPTVISTNMNPLELQEEYSERIISRFQGHYTMLKFFGGDIRAKKKYAVRHS